jgi:hypothetical protein
VLIRVFEHGHVAYEVTITGVHQELLSQSLFDIPDEYQQLGPARGDLCGKQQVSKTECKCHTAAPPVVPTARNSWPN